MSRCGKSAVRNLRTAALVAAALMIAASIAIAAEEGADVVRKYPPYPDVWGRVLPFPNLGNGHYYINTEAYERPDGTVEAVAKL